MYGGKPSVVIDNTLDRQFTVDAPDGYWVEDITYLRTQEGFAYFRVFIDLFSRRVVGWAVLSRQTSELAVQALLMATWRRKPRPGLLIYSDQGAQFTSREWAAFLREHTLEHSVSRRGNCAPIGSMLCMRLPGGGQRCCRELLSAPEAAESPTPEIPDARGIKARCL